MSIATILSMKWLGGWGGGKKGNCLARQSVVSLGEDEVNRKR